MNQNLNTSRPILKQDLYDHYLKELEDTGLTSHQAKTILTIWWDMMGWF